MANRIINDSIDKFIGLKFPLTNSPFGYFNPSIITRNQIKSNIKNLIMTRRGERVMRPELGSNIYDLVFEKINTQTIRDHIDTYIKDEIHK